MFQAGSVVRIGQKEGIGRVASYFCTTCRPTARPSLLFFAADTGAAFFVIAGKPWKWNTATILQVTGIAVLLVVATIYLLLAAEFLTVDPLASGHVSQTWADT